MLVVLLLVAVAAALTQQNGEGRSTLRSRDVSGSPLLRSYGPSEDVNVWSKDDAFFSGVPPGKMLQGIRDAAYGGPPPPLGEADARH
ncbi:hypothetical protein Emag_006819 [Eimeria magna]